MKNYLVLVDIPQTASTSDYNFLSRAVSYKHLKADLLSQEYFLLYFINTRIRGFVLAYIKLIKNSYSLRHKFIQLQVSVCEW